MAWWITNNESIKLNSPDEARTLAEKLNLHKATLQERELKAERVERIQEKIEHSKTLTFHWHVAHLEAQELSWRVDGQHSSLAFLGLTEAQWRTVRFPLVVSWTDYHCDTRADVGELMRQFNQSWSTRSHEDNVGAVIGTDMELYTALGGGGRHITSHAVKGIVWYTRRVKNDTLSEDAEYELILDPAQQAFFTYCCGFLQRRQTHDLHKPPVMAAIYHTTQKESEAPKLFWKLVAAGHPGNEATSIPYELATILEKFGDKKAEWQELRQQLRGKIRPSPNDIFATCLRACLAFEKGAQPSQLLTLSRNMSPRELAEKYYPLTELPDLLTKKRPRNKE
jgi:hypothetical protein